MRQLRLVGVHEDGGHLLLSGEDGSSFSLPIDEALRAAVARPIGRPAAMAAGQPPAPLTPREIQARIRAGATAEQVAEESGMPMESILRYEGPVRAERDYVAEQARRVEVSGPQAHDAYRGAFGDEPASLGEMVAHRVGAFGVDAEAVQWDAWRRADGAWEITASFEPPAGDSRTNIGEEPPARWLFHPSRKALQNTNRWAQVLSEIEPMDTPVAGRRLSAVADHPFDVEAQEEAAEERSGGEFDNEEFLDMLRARRGQRLGDDADGDDALALMLSRGEIPAAHPRDEEFVDEAEARRLGFAPDHHDDGDGVPELPDGVSPETSEFTVVPALRPLRPGAEPDAPEAKDDAGADGQASPKKKQKRSSVPSWDEIVFGRKHD